MKRIINGSRRLYCTMIALTLMVSAHALASDVDSIPFLYRDHLFVPAYIDGNHQANVIYDTGAADMFGVDSVYLLLSDWKPQNFSYAMTGGGAGKSRIKIIVGPVQTSIGTIDSKYKIMPIFKLRDVVDCHVDGIWGIKGIEECPFEINFEHSFLKRYKNCQPDLDGYECLPIRYEDDRIMLQAQVVIDGKSIEGWYLMDTGAGSSMIFTAAAVEEYQLESLPGKRHIIDITQFGIGDKAQEEIVSMQSQLIVIGSDTIRDEEIFYITEGVGAFSDREYLGVIGNDVWSSYNIVIDASKGVMYLKRFKEHPPVEPSYGYSFRNRTDIGMGWIVSAITRDGEAAKAGLQLNDRIIAVNGKPVEDYTWEEENDINKLPEQVLDVLTPTGTSKQIRLTPKLMW